VPNTEKLAFEDATVTTISGIGSFISNSSSLLQDMKNIAQSAKMAAKER
jgi:hypothetical protein